MEPVMVTTVCSRVERKERMLSSSRPLWSPVAGGVVIGLEFPGRACMGEAACFPGTPRGAAAEALSGP